MTSLRGRLCGPAFRAVTLLLSTSVVQPISLHADAATPLLAAITVSFKLDPRLSGATYGGELWVSRPSFSSAAQPGKEGSVEVKVRGVDARGSPVEIVPEWTAAEPDMVTVTPREKGLFQVTVKRVGTSRLRVAALGITKDLVVKLKELGNAVQVEIVQVPASD